MSDTPRTDAVTLDPYKARNINGTVVPSDFARTLERELAAERAEHKRTSRQANEAIETANAAMAVERKAR